jgi:exonuclease V gamma subunit
MSVTSARLNKSTPALSGLHVHLAPDLETHSNTLIQSLLPAYSSPETSLDALFNPPTLVVPNTIVGDYLRRRIACSELECAFGIEVQTFSAFISSQSSSDVGYTVDRLRTAVLAVFFTPILRSKLPKQLASYLDSAPPGVKHPGLRRYQMADRLARVFSRYDREQADILDAWNKNSVAPCGKLRSATEEWQRDLSRLMRKTGLLPLKGEELSDSKDTSVRKLQINPPTSSLKPTHTPIYLVGFSVLPEKSIKDLITIAQGRRLDVLLVAPRAETLTAAIAGDPIPLWIKPQMETLAALRRLLPKDAFQNEDTIQSSTKDETPLKALQRLISTAQPPAKRLDYSKDHTLRILGCPGITREAEVIADEIWRLLAYDEPKQTSDRANITMSDISG